jgi:hypothetical protein
VKYLYFTNPAYYDAATAKNKNLWHVHSLSLRANEAAVFGGSLCVFIYQKPCVLKTPKTESSIRKIYIPRTVSEMLARQKAEQDKIKEMLGSEYQDYGLVMATGYGMPMGTGSIHKRFAKLIEENNLPEVVFHSLRHTSVTYKLKLNRGDIKSVQGDSGHAQVSMVTDVYSHIIDEDRKKNAERFEEAFYGKKNLNPQMTEDPREKIIAVPEGVDSELLTKVLNNPEMAALLSALAKSMPG